MEANITVNLPQNSYQIKIASGILAKLGENLRQLNLDKKVLLVSSPEIFQYYGQKAIDSLEKSNFEVITHLIPAGENHKTLESIQALYDVALNNLLERSSTLLALGGGVIGDMTGFAAATWLRGLNFVQVPTTLLAMVDASIGGKTGVNHPKGKNLIGAFYQPRIVLIDPELLQTLSTREFRAGMAEVIKYGIIWDEELFERLESSPVINEFAPFDPDLLQYILFRSCQAKANIVGQDERESGIRAILNYGHTIGHAIESLTGYTLVNHGEAVSIGMVAAGRIAGRLGLWSLEQETRQKLLIEKAGLPIAIPTRINLLNIIDSLKSDKKVKAGIARFILPHKIGQAFISEEVTSELILSSL
jgi:3-dehydroquinate synthase